ncbi:MAG: hypothetical protein ACXVEF_24060 [Polyangiales bacterium]
MKHASLAVVLVLAWVGCTSSAVVDASAPVAGSDPAVSTHIVCDHPKGKSTSVSCRVSHDAAGRCAICWVVQLDCKNGRHLRAEACDEVAPGTELVHQLDDIPDRKRCDLVETGTVTSAWTRDCSS